MGGRGASHLFAILVVLLALVAACSTTATAEWTAEVTTSPTAAYQSVAFDYNVTIHNTGNTTMHVTNITLDIMWGHDWMFPDSSPPHEFYQIYSGDQDIGVGQEHTFRASVKSGFFGSFPTTTMVTAYWNGDSSPTSQNISGAMTFTSAPPAPPNPLSGAVCLGFLFILLLGSMVIGFYWNKMWWSHEIDNALKTRNPDDFLRWKWRAYYWEDEGDMWKNYLAWVIAALLLTLLVLLLAST